MIVAVSQARWNDPDVIAEAQAWGRKSCARLGLDLAGPIEQPHIRPWSTVFRIPTARGAVYLKACGPSQAHEPRLTALLQREVPDLVPSVLALHPRHPWMLVAEGGRKLREAFSPEEMLAEWERLMPRYAELQLRLASRCAEMLAFGTPDRRMRRMADDFAALLADERLVGQGGQGALTIEELSALHRLVPVIASSCDALAALGLPDSVEHNDLHDGNVLVDGDRRVVFDWGDACVSQPFLSVMLPLRMAAFRLSLSENAPAIRRLAAAYAEPFSAFAPPAVIAEALELGRRLGQVNRALTWHVVATRIPEALELGYDTASSLRRILATFS
jgi:hypothetical protein